MLDILDFLMQFLLCSHM